MAVGVSRVSPYRPRASIAGMENLSWFGFGLALGPLLLVLDALRVRFGRRGRGMHALVGVDDLFPYSAVPLWRRLTSRVPCGEIERVAELVGRVEWRDGEE